MPLESKKHRFNPLNTLAWATSVALLGITKLSQGKKISSRQKKAVMEVKEKTKLLFRERTINSEDYLNGSLASEGDLVDTFLFSIKSSDSESVQPMSEIVLREAISNLESIVSFLSSGDEENIETEKLEKTRQYCSNLLDLLNSQPANDELVSRN